MMFFNFKPKSGFEDDPRLTGREILKFKIHAHDRERAIIKYSKLNVMPLSLSNDDIKELFSITIYNYALNGEVKTVGQEGVNHVS